MAGKNRRSHRLRDFDYAASATYFVTICEAERRPVFGYITGTVALSSLGRIVDEEWQRTGALRDYVELREYVVMPNHFHALLRLTRSVAPNHSRRKFGESRRASLSSIIGNFKGAVTRRARTELPQLEWAWQPRFYDHVVRDEVGLLRITRYIRENPLKWLCDRENPGFNAVDEFHDWLKGLPSPEIE